MHFPLVVGLVLCASALSLSYKLNGSQSPKSAVATAHFRSAYVWHCSSLAGKQYYAGQSWKEGRFLVICSKGWLGTTVSPIACLSSDYQTKHSAGERWSEGRNAFRCKPIREGLQIINAVPGSGGSQIWAKLNKTSVIHPWCHKRSNSFFELWISFELLIPGAIDCLADNSKLNFDATTQRTTPNEGVEFYIPGFGETSSIEYLSSTLQIAATSYMHEFVDVAVNEWGYEIGKTIRGAPYDWRKAPNDMPEYFVNLKQLIEDAYAVDNNKVTLVAHSLGGLFSLYFLHSQTEEWRAKYIKSYVTMSTPWAGTTSSITTQLSGATVGFPAFFVDPTKMRVAQRTWPGLAVTMAWPDVYPLNETFIVTEHRNYSTNDFEQLFSDVNYPKGYEVFKSVQKLYEEKISPATSPPNVEAHCLIGTGLPTKKIATYGKNGFPDVQPDWTYEDGDGTVSQRSASLCNVWAGQQSQAFNHKSFANVDHVGMVKSPTVLAYIRSVVVLP